LQRLVRSEHPGVALSVDHHSIPIWHGAGTSPAEIEEGKRNVCLMNLEVIANGFGVTLAKLFSRV
jgi:hypothetical protein